MRNLNGGIMANNVTDVSFSPYGSDISDIQRKRAMAQALQQQSLDQEPTQTAGGWAVKQSPLAPLAKVLQAGVGAFGQRKADEQQKELGERYQADYKAMIAKGLRQLQGGAGSAQPDAELGGGPSQPAQGPDPMAALATFGEHPGGAQFAPLAMQQIQQQLRQAMLAKLLPGMAGGGAGGQPGAQPAGGGAGGFGAGIPPQIIGLMTSGDPELVKLGQSLLEANKGIAQRPGAPVVNPFTGAIIAQPTPAVPAGVGLQVGPGGPQAYPVPGAQGAMAGIAASQAGATEAGKAPFQLGTYNTPGAPTLMTHQQAIERATGQPMPNPAAPQQQPGPALPSPQGAPVPLPRQVGGGLRLQDQGASAEQHEFGKNLGEYASGVQKEAANAAVSNRYLDNMQAAAQDFNPGKLAPMQSTLTQWAQAMNLPVSEEDKKAAGSIQALTSMGIKMAGQATRQSDASPSQLQYFKMLESMPNESRTPEGFNKIIAYLRDTNNYAVSKHQNLQQWRQTHDGSAEGFEAQWPNVAKKLPFVWNQASKTKDFKGMVEGAAGPRMETDDLVNKWLRR